jgi:hypothetical protein
MKIEINIKMTKELNAIEQFAISELTENEKFLYSMAIRQDVFESLELNELLNPKIEIEIK